MKQVSDMHAVFGLVITLLMLSPRSISVVPKDIPVEKDLLPRTRTEVEWQAGLHYSIFVPPRGVNAVPAKVQLRVPFLYTYGKHTDNEFFHKWLKTKPDYIHVVMAPNIRWPHAREQARMYFTLKMLGHEDLHVALYDWINDSTENNLEGVRYRIYHNLHYPDIDAIFLLNLEFAKMHDIDEKRFTDVYYSKAMNDIVAQAEFDAQSNGFQEIVINGRYFTSASRLAYLAKYPQPLKSDDIYSQENMIRLFQLIEYLAESENERMIAQANRKSGAAAK